MSDLENALTEIDGVGEKTAEKIMAVVAEHDTGGSESRLLEKAREAAMAGDDREAGVWLRRDSSAE